MNWLSGSTSWLNGKGSCLRRNWNEEGTKRKKDNDKDWDDQFFHRGCGGEFSGAVIGGKDQWLGWFAAIDLQK